MPISATLVVGALAAAVGAGAAAKADRVGITRPDFVAAEDPAWSPDGQRIAFVATRSRSGNAPRALYVINGDGSGLRRVTRPGFASRWPTWSPDGRRIAFQHQTVGPSGSTADIYVVRGDGTGLQRIVANAFAPAWGPGGRKIAFSRYIRRLPFDTSQILVASPDGSGIRLVADPLRSTSECNGFFQPTWSPDGEFVAFSVSSAGGECSFSVFIGSSRGYGAMTKVLARQSFTEPDWSPDGGKLAVTSYSLGRDRRPYIVAIYNLRTHRTRHLRTGSHPRWSPDARQLVFVRNSAIYVMNADGSNVRQLTR